MTPKELQPILDRVREFFDARPGVDGGDTLAEELVSELLQLQALTPSPSGPSAAPKSGIEGARPVPPHWCPDHGDVFPEHAVLIHRDEDNIGLCDRELVPNEDADMSGPSAAPGCCEKMREACAMMATNYGMRLPLQYGGRAAHEVAAAIRALPLPSQERER